MNFPKKLAELRNEFNMTQKELASKLGVSRGTIGMYEIGQRDPDTETLIKIAELFNVSVDYLLGRSNIRNPLNNDATTSTKNENNPYDIDTLSPESKKELEKYIQLLKLKDEMDKTRDETSSVSEKNA